MNDKQKIKLFEDVFAPKENEKILFLVDLPHNNYRDSVEWKQRRKMAEEWKNLFEEMGKEKHFSVSLDSYPATGLNNAPLPAHIIEKIKDFHLVIAMTEFSATASLASLCNKKDTITRCASMPGVEKRMEKTSFQADYIRVKKYAMKLKKLLDDATSARIAFSTKDTLNIDLRNRVAGADTGECQKKGQTINFPSGEGFIAPYEGFVDEIDLFGESKTEGVLPLYIDDEIIRCTVKYNRIDNVITQSSKANKFNDFLSENKTRRNIAELGIGCNPNAVVIGNILEDEKVPGLHIAYGMSSHIGGKIKSDLHQDICFPKGALVEAESLDLIIKKGEIIRVIFNSRLRFELLE